MGRDREGLLSALFTGIPNTTITFGTEAEEKYALSAKTEM
jgi:hypothetical protein